MIGFDVVIIGGGLSGSSTALNLSKKGYSVLIIEKEKSQDYKPCAGGMASSMQRFLPLNIEDCIESKIKNVEFRWKAADNVTADLTGESPFWIVKREKLDQLLLDESLNNGAQIMRPLFIKVPKPIFKLSLRGNAHANPYFINPNSNLTASLGISPNPFNLNESVFANFGFLGPKLK